MLTVQSPVDDAHVPAEVYVPHRVLVAIQRTFSLQDAAAYGAGTTNR